jgi:hypothetical protein
MKGGEKAMRKAIRFKTALKPVTEKVRRKAAKIVKECGGYLSAETITGIPHSTLNYIVQGRFSKSHWVDAISQY